MKGQCGVVRRQPVRVPEQHTPDQECEAIVGLGRRPHRLVHEDAGTKPVQSLRAQGRSDH